MLAQSRIPPSRFFVGRAQEIAFPREKFDFIFSLGVTTYQDPADLAATLRFISERLATNGTAVISFTNRSSLDHLMRSTIRRLAKPLIKRGVIGQEFVTHAYTLADVESMIGKTGLRASRPTFLNQAFSPFNTIFPKPSVALAKFIERNIPKAILPVLSSDFVIFAGRRRD